jgi:ribonuclease BN (tRNA processing enzyme)
VEGFPGLWKKFHPDLPDMLTMPQLNFFAMPKDGEISIGQAKLKAFNVHHGFGKVGAVAYRLQTPEGIFVYSGDTGECEGIRQAAQDADIFVCECSAVIGDNKNPTVYGHLNPFVAGDIAAKSGVKKLVFFHYTGLDSDQAIVKECQRAGFKNEIIVGKDFQVFRFC